MKKYVDADNLHRRLKKYRSGALVHNAGSVAVMINSALLLRWFRSGE